MKHSGNSHTTVVLIADRAMPRVCKIGYGLKANGCRVVLLHRGNIYVSETEKCFDEIYKFSNGDELLDISQRFKPVVYHIFSSWNFDVAAFFIQNKIGRVVFDDYDILTGVLRDNPADIQIDKNQLLYERYCLENADGIACRSMEFQHVKRTVGIRNPGKTIFFPDYCWDRDLQYTETAFSDELHLVFAGNVAVEKQYSRNIRKEHFYLDFARHLSGKGTHLHLYPSAAYDNFEEVFSEHLELAAKSSYFHVHPFIPADRLIEEMGRYDVGLQTSWRDVLAEGEAYYPAKNVCAMSNKIFDYIDAGLGIVLGDYRFMLWFVSRLGIGIHANFEDFDEKFFTRPLSFWINLRERAARARKLYSVKRQAKRLIDFYSSLGHITGKKVFFMPAMKEDGPTTEASHLNVRTGENSHSCLFLNTSYTAFLNNLYLQNKTLASQSYKTQLCAIQGEFFGDSDFYSNGLREAGWQAEDLIINCPPLQEAWAKENGASGNWLEIALSQVRKARPDVIYIQDMNVVPKDFIDHIRRYTRLVVGQIATPITNAEAFNSYDIIFSCAPHFVEHFRKAGLTAYYQPLGFDPRVLRNSTDNLSRPFDCSFVGGLSGLHVKAYELLDVLARETPIRFWGYGSETLPEGSPVRARHHGEAWGKDMFAVLSSSMITVNRHGEIAENYACNMRLFEATGCGALLITDYKDNLGDLFDIGREVVAYRSAEECAALIKYYLNNPKEAENIAVAGRTRTLRDHTYGKRMQKTAEVLERHLRYRREEGLHKPPDLSGISYGHTPIEESQISSAMLSAWKDETIPLKQRALVRQSLSNMYTGNAPAECRVLADIIRPLLARDCPILEIGCASGYYYEILEYLLNRNLDYTGVDYSESLISMAHDYYPRADFHVADGANLPFADRRFRIVISSCILLHTQNYRQHISETARVASDYVVAHRTPVCRNRQTRYMKKFAYGVETVELIFNETGFLGEFEGNGLKLVDSMEYYAEPNNDLYHVTYLFRKNCA